MSGHHSLELVRSDGSPRRALVIGLVNNSAPRVRLNMERQFLALLRAARPDLLLSVQRFACPGVHHSCGTQDGAGNVYVSTDEVVDAGVDALIVTGMEPQAHALCDEPAWEGLTKLADWAEDKAIPVIWSCLAAHVAVLHLDGIARKRYVKKVSGLYLCKSVGSHPLAVGMQSQWICPHSRYNGIPEDALVAHGYELLSSSDDVGADNFLRQRGASFLFFQGHPEYEADTLSHEYKRDVRRYLTGKQDNHPPLPKDYFDVSTRLRLTQIRDEILRGDRDLERLREICDLVDGLTYQDPWRVPAAHLVANWLAGTAGARDLGTKNFATNALSLASGEEIRF